MARTAICGLRPHASIVMKASHVTSMTAGDTSSARITPWCSHRRQSSKRAAPAARETSASTPSINPAPKIMIAVNTPLPIPVAAIAAGPRRPTMIVSTRPMLIQPISARTTGPARRRRGRSSENTRGSTVFSLRSPVPPALKTGDRRPETSECQTESDLADALFGLSEVSGKRGRLHERGERRTRGPAATRRQRDERVLRVEQVEHFGDRLDA